MKQDLEDIKALLKKIQDLIDLINEDVRTSHVLIK